MNYWTDKSIGEIMRDENLSKIVLKVVEDDNFLTSYFNTFGKKAQHSFAEVEEGSVMAGSISKDKLNKIRSMLEKA